MSANSIRIEEIPLGHPRLRVFVSFPWQLYRGNPYWTPPLTAELLGNSLLKMPGLLTPSHPYHRGAEVTHFLAWRRDQLVGRISAAINHRFNEYHKGRFGFFGFFDVVNDYEVARVLLDRVCDWVSKRGITIVRGPGEYSCATHERQGVLVEGFNYPNCFDTTYNYPYYQEFLERYGFIKAKDYMAHTMGLSPGMLSRMRQVAARIRQRSKFETRCVTRQSLNTDVRLMLEIYNDAWAQNWGFLPVSPDEAEGIAGYLRVFGDSGLARLAFIKGEAVAMLGILPDPNWCLRPTWRWYGDTDAIRIVRLLVGRRRIRRLRWFFFGVREQFRNQGVDILLGNEVLEYLASRNYSFIEGSMHLEDNWRTIKALETIGMRHSKTWRIYDMEIA